MQIEDFAPKIPSVVQDDRLDTSWEFALKNFPGWWATMTNLGFSEIELINYVSYLRSQVSN